MVDEAFAHKFFPRENPLGKRIDLEGAREPFQIVGLVVHVKQWSIDADETQSLQAQLYEPFRQLSGSPSSVGVVMRAEGSAGKTGTPLFD